MHVYISSYKAALGSKKNKQKKLSKNKAKQITIFKGPESIQHLELFVVSPLLLLIFVLSV